RNLYAGQEAAVRTGHGTTDWFQIRKGVRQGCILSPCLFNLYAEYIMRNAGLEEAQAGIKIAGKNISNLRYADDTTLMAESEEELKSLLMKVKAEREKCDSLPSSILSPPGSLDSGFVPNLQDFDNKLTEADAYLQILDDEQRKKTETLKEATNSLVESIKHCIVSLQIAKSTINPVDAIYQPWKLWSTQTYSELCDSEQRSSSLPVGSALATLGHHHTPTPNSTGSGHSPPSSSLTAPRHVNLSPNTVPEFSYSNEFLQSGSSPKCLIDSLASASVLIHRVPRYHESLNSSISNGTSDADLFDSHDSRNDQGEAGSVEKHKSVIMHLLSQVRLGMDLMKVERMQTFAHPDLLVSISDQKDARDRMVQVVKWYLSAFHAGRRGSVAKKPYNPIWGEIFQCHWTLPNDTEENAELVSEGPVPWVSKNSGTFVAEQISHHPPISAIYAECFNKKIQFNAHIWPRSKFLGMSIMVHNIGQDCVSCLEHDECYILTFPNVYSRSILTVPWLELGGECNISCSKSDYSANIIFHTKPFYGGKKHRITTEIFFSQTTRSLSAQLKGNVCKILKREKCSFYRYQEEKEIQWETRLFHEDGECWVFDGPLLKISLGSSTHGISQAKTVE
uniref:Oxysterol-binding protein n=1 Tax=Capra hircus TaxID=9925 RepID=A0A452EFA1_CAPHI